MTAGGFGQLRATDADRESVRVILEEAHAEGRLTWEEFDARATALESARTYDQLAELTRDLPRQAAGAPLAVRQGLPAAPRGTNALAIASLACGVSQLLFSPLTGIPAVVLGHMARGQIRRTGEDGAGMALVGLVLGYSGLAAAVIVASVVVMLGLWIFH